jgi:hypothetical protein
MNCPWCESNNVIKKGVRKIDIPLINDIFVRVVRNIFRLIQ